MKQLLDRVIIVPFLNQAVPVKKPFGVSVNDENFFAKRVQQDGIGCFRADAVNREEFCAEDTQRHSFHPFEIPLISRKQKV